MNNGIIFDLDGTLWDSSRQVVDAWKNVINECEDINYNITVQNMHGLMGKTIEEIAKIIFNNVSEQRGLEVIKKCCIEEQFYIEKHGGILYPKLEETLKVLSEKYNLFIVSNCQEGYIESFLKYHKLNEYFSDYENHGRTNLSKGENIKSVIERNKLDKAVYIGDTLGDFQAAKLAGIPFVHAKYGFGNIEEKNHFINEISELPHLVEYIMNCYNDN